MTIIAQRYKVSGPAKAAGSSAEGSNISTYSDSYLCVDSVTGSDVLLKAARSMVDKKKQRECDELIRKQSQILDRCRHRNVIRALASGVWNGRPYLVLERCKGKSFLDVVREMGPGRLDEKVAQERVAWIAQAAEGLAAVHAAGFVHASVGPENFSIEADQRVVLSGFEKAASRQDEGCDVLAFGEMALELLNGSGPASVNEILAACQNTDPARRPTAMALSDALTRCSELIRRKTDARERAVTDIRQNKPLDAVARWDDLSQLDPSDREPFEQANSILLPLFAEALSRYDFAQASEIEARIDLGMATPEQREWYRRLWAAMNEAQTKDRLIDRHVRMARVFHSEGRLEEERLQLTRALAIDANHPSLGEVARTLTPSQPLAQPAAAAAAAASPMDRPAADAETSAQVAVLEPHAAPVMRAALAVPDPPAPPKFAVTEPRRKMPWTAVAGSVLLLIGLVTLGQLWMQRQAAVAAVEHKSYKAVAYNDPVFADCLGVATCLERKQHAASLMAVAKWDTVRFDSPWLADCMGYQPCLKAAAEATALQKLNFRKLARKDPRRANCRGWKPCLSVFPATSAVRPTEADDAGATSAAENPATRVRKRPSSGLDQSPAPTGNEKLYRTKD